MLALSLSLSLSPNLGMRLSTAVPLIKHALLFLVYQISAWQGGEDIELFHRTNLILSGQVPFSDCIAEGNFHCWTNSVSPNYNNTPMVGGIFGESVCVWEGGWDNR